MEASVLLTPFRMIAEQPILLKLSLALYVIAQIGMNVLMEPLKKYPGGYYTPDIHFPGYTVEQLNAYYDNLGVEGCAVYIQVANWDLFPYMLGYVFPLGALHCLVARRLRQKKSGKHDNNDDSKAYLALVIWLMDVVETVLQRRGCVIYPDRLSSWQIRLAGTCQRLKWTLGALSVGQLLVGVWQIFRQAQERKQRYVLPQFAARTE